MADAKHSPFAPPPEEPPSRGVKSLVVICIFGLIVVAVILSLFALGINIK